MEEIPFERLRVYQGTLEFVKSIYYLCKQFSREEQFALVDQLKRAATSILLNIAESQGRATAKDKAHFLYNSRGSIYEVFSILDIALSLNFITEKEVMICREKPSVILKQLNSLISYYQK